MSFNYHSGGEDQFVIVSWPRRNAFCPREARTLYLPENNLVVCLKAMPCPGILESNWKCNICCSTLLHDHTCLFRVHQKKHRLFGFSSCRDRGNGKKRHKKSASFAIWGLPHVQASLEQAEHHSTLFLCFAAYFSAVFRPISRSSSGQDTWNAACLLSPFHKSQQSHKNVKMLCSNKKEKSPR